MKLDSERPESSGARIAESDLDRRLVTEHLAAVSTVAAGIAHEINNPLTAIVANLEIVLGENGGANGKNLDDEVRAQLADALLAAVRVREIVRNLRYFSRADTSGVHTPIDLIAAIDATLNAVMGEVRHRAHLDALLDAVPMVLIGSARFTHVLLNLISNAADAFPPDRPTRENTITVRTRTTPAGWSCVEIEDNGRGMAPAVLSKAFSPFFTTKQLGEGTGLGLSTCLSIIKAAGGRIEIESEPGRGTKVTILLPPATAKTPTRPTSEPAPTPSRRGEVLVVDDEPAIGRVVRRALAADHEVTVVTSAEDALGYLRSGARFDVILCDLMMPVMTGMEFYSVLQDEFADMADRVVFLTGGSFTAAGRAFLDQTPLTCIEKPFEVDELRATVAHHVAAVAE